MCNVYPKLERVCPSGETYREGLAKDILLKLMEQHDGMDTPECRLARMAVKQANELIRELAAQPYPAPDATPGLVVPTGP